MLLGKLAPVDLLDAGSPEIFHLLQNADSVKHDEVEQGKGRVLCDPPRHRGAVRAEGEGARGAHSKPEGSHGYSVAQGSACGQRS